MAIEKQITAENGVTLGYHRVVSVNSIVNQATIIEVCSYVDSAARDREKLALESGEPMDIYTLTRYFEAAYDPSMSVIGAYGYIKGIDPFKGSVDVFEE